MRAAAPSYTSPGINASADTAGAAPPYAFPDAFPICGHPRTKPFVRASQIKDHLALLNAFAELKVFVTRHLTSALPFFLSSVEEMTNVGVPYLPLNDERRWTCFVGMAVERFELWCKALQPSHSEKGIAAILPPVDVLMVWHAYLLNPGWYAEDGARVEVLKGLHQAGNRFAALLGNGLGELLTAEPSQERIENWVHMTATPFDYFGSAKQIVERQIACPKCRAVVCVHYLTADGTGYLQQKFQKRCIAPACGFEIRRDSLALRKFAKDLATTRPDMETAELLAGTVHTPSDVLNLGHGKHVKKTILNSHTPSLRRPTGSTKTVISDKEYADFLMEKGDYKLEKVREILAMKMKAPRWGKLINRIMSAYVDDKIFSVELVGAATHHPIQILRQGSFVTKMHKLQWTKPGFFDSAEDEIALQHAIARYHAFLDLMSSSPASFFVPTLDIDLVWHTHQLMATNYSKDTIKYVGRFVDHDDKVEESQLATSFDLTCRGWKSRFGVQYTHCGCPLPGETIGQRLSRLVGHGSNPSYLIPPNRDDLLAATHPSDHNAVFAFHHKAASEAAQRRRRLKIAKRERRDAKRARAGKPDSGRRNVQHDPAFLIPVPLHYTPVVAGCTTSAGNIIHDGARCGGCAAVGVSVSWVWLLIL
ncbi:hypothetical protein K438DRAFT_1591187 [Mycena galopus ATCC 62051]|nr:hypothetical protein K438DRAFT_1591187 [Mycena galopus ATCC 62051]